MADERQLGEMTFMTVAEVAAVMRVSKMTVYRLVHSGELPAVRVGRSFRVPKDAEYADSEEAAHQWGAFTLGVSATTPLDLANAYATLAADGNYCEPIPVQRIQDMSGAKLDVANPRCKRVMSTDVARAWRATLLSASRRVAIRSSPTSRVTAACSLLLGPT